MPGLSDYWRDDQFREWLRMPANEVGVKKLLSYLNVSLEGAKRDALKAGDTEFEKGGVAKLNQIINDIQNLMSDTETETG
jgi:hypothetical protein